LLPINILKLTKKILLKKSFITVVFYLIKYTLEIGFSFLFNAFNSIRNYVFQKKSYQNYISLICYPFILLITYQTNFNSSLPVFILIGGYSVFLFIATILAILNHRKLFFRKYYVFILYLCTFEIAPYLFSFYLINKTI